MIPSKAIEAAVHAYMQYPRTRGLDNTENMFRAALEAAAPHMLAGLRSELVKLAQEFEQAEGGTLAYTVIVDRFGMRKNAHDQLIYVIDNHIGEAK